MPCGKQLVHIGIPDEVGWADDDEGNEVGGSHGAEDTRWSKIWLLGRSAGGGVGGCWVPWAQQSWVNPLPT